MSFLVNPLAKKAYNSPGVQNFLFGEPGRNEQISNLTPEQQDLFSQLLQAIQGEGAGGGFGDAADYYRSLLSGGEFDAQSAPELRRFNEQTIPSLAEQFAGMGSGALSSGGFKLATAGAATDLAERLAALRSQLRSQGAAGLSGLAQQGLQPNVENIYRPAKEGFLGRALGPALAAAGTAIGGPALGAAGAAFGNTVKGWLQPGEVQKGSTSPYGGQ